MADTFAPASAFLVTRYNADGSLDQGFGTAGKATAVDGGNASALAVQADGKIVVAGVCQQMDMILPLMGVVLNRAQDRKAAQYRYGKD